MNRLGWLIGSVAILLVGIADHSGAGEAATAPTPIGYNRDIRPILSDKCFRCHGPDRANRQADLRLDRREDALADHDGRRPIVPGKPADSELYRRIAVHDEGEHMPPSDSGSKIAPAEIALLERWIAAGAHYEPHWSFVPPRQAASPQVRRQDWPRNPIDSFVLAELERRGLAPSPEANRETLLRRVSLDLTGLPPTPAELNAFLADKSPDAYEKVVDRLLASPRYGERMALDWLDAARYADSNGFYNDLERHAWPWRDWVIRAFASNMPFDQFTIEQLAGDLLPQATQEQRVATGFNRNHMVTAESGVIDEEYRVGYVVDRVDTTSTVWLGMTIGCARCHDHKYDPISQQEYYSLFACFNNVPERGLTKDPINPPPVMSLPSAEQAQQLVALRKRLDECQLKVRSLEPELKSSIAAWEPRATAELDAIPVDGNQAAFDFNENTADHSPKQLKTNTVGSFSYAPGVVGKAAEFHESQYVELSEPANFDADKPFSVALWIKPGSSTFGCVLTKMRSTADSRGFELNWYKGQTRINLINDFGHQAIEIGLKQTFPAGRWHHVAVTYDGSSKAAGLKVFIDGQSQVLAIRRDSLSGSIATDEPWRIGWKGTGAGLEGSLDELRIYDRPLAAREVEAIYWREMVQGAIETPVAERSKQQQDQLRDYYVAHHASPSMRRAWNERTELTEQEAALTRSIPTTLVMQEMEKPRDTFILVRGQYDQHGGRVGPGIPRALGTLPSDSPPSRLGFARWLVSPENPLTARVAVNRFWQMAFGEGLVRTSYDFGLQGDLPSHPELLDWLAVQFMKSHWDVKALLRLIVTSSTYRQSSNFSRELLERDPENRALARGPRYRLSAEQLRDQALAVGGLLVNRIGGPSVRPYQPAGLWEAVSYNGDQSYVQDHGDALYRRSLYIFWKRQSPPPTMLTFDSPTRETCSVRRARTNTPLQALVLLNDTTYVEAARGLATRIMRDAGPETVARLNAGFRLATARVPSDAERTALKNHYERQLAAYRQRPEAARALLAVGESPVDAKLDPCELAAWTTTAEILLNLDETITQH
jgi:hypothetical protein